MFRKKNISQWKTLTIDIASDLSWLRGCRVRLVSPIGAKKDFKGDSIFESAAWFFLIILKFIFTSIFEIKIHEKKIWVR